MKAKQKNKHFNIAQTNIILHQLFFNRTKLSSHQIVKLKQRRNKRLKPSYTYLLSIILTHGRTNFYKGKRKETLS